MTWSILDGCCFLPVLRLLVLIKDAAAGESDPYSVMPIRLIR